MSEPLFNPVNFSRMVRLHGAKHRLSQRKMAKAIGVSPATLCRVCNEKAPNVETYLRIKKWIEP